MIIWYFFNIIFILKVTYVSLLVSNLADVQILCLFLGVLVFSVAGRMYLFLPSPSLIVALIGPHMTEVVLQEILRTLLGGICIFRKENAHFCLGENADHHQENLFSQGNIRYHQGS